MTPIRLSPATLRLLVAAAIGLILFVAAATTWPLTLRKDHLNDFDIFHLAGRLILAGDLAQAYDREAFLRIQATIPSNDGGAMYWSYPPPYDLVVAPLALLPIGVAFILFMGSTLAFYLWVLRRLAGEAFQSILLVMLPLVALILASGQNSFLTSGLLGLSALLLLEGRRSGGVPLGLMIIKPHLALGLGVALLLRRATWAAAGISFATIAAVALAATLILGPESWSLFRHGIASTSELLANGAFLGFRMASAFAALTAVGVSSDVAMAVQTAVAVAALAGLVALRVAGRDARVLIGFGLAATAVLSPYLYDYDLTFLGLAAAILAAPLAARARAWEVQVLVVGMLAIGLYGLIANVLGNLAPDVLLQVDGVPVPLIAPILLPLTGLLWTILRREPATHDAALPRSVGALPT